MKYTRLFLSLALMILSSVLLLSCTGGTVEPEDSAAGTGAQTDAPTDAPTAAPSEAPTEPADEPSDTQDTQPVTDTPVIVTEPETLPPDAPKDPAVITFFADDRIADCIRMSGGTECLFDTDEAFGTVLRLACTGERKVSRASFKLDYPAYMKLVGLEPLDYSSCAYAVLRVRVENLTTSGLGLRVQRETGGSSKTTARNETYRLSEPGWQTVLFALAGEGESGALTEIGITFAETMSEAGEAVVLQSVALFGTLEEAMTYADYTGVNPRETVIEVEGLTQTYTFLHVTDLHACLFTDDDTASYSAERRTYIKNRVPGFSSGMFTSAERMPFFFRYADRIGADLILLSGDILDFPSDSNVKLLRDCIAGAKTPSFFVLGNHDWAFADDYQTQHARDVNIPLFTDISGGDPYFHMIEYDDLILVALDNSPDWFVGDCGERFLSLLDTTDKPVILMLHVPFTVPTLEPECRRVWGGRNICIGPGALSASSEIAQKLYYRVAQDPDTPVAAVIAGHLHFDHEDVFENGVPQILTGTASDGTCRVITVRPKSE